MKNFLWKCIKSMVFCVGISYTVIANSSEIIQVQAEGSGTSKLEATKNAWQEAIRQAVGVYMSSKTFVLDDDITESIAAYSRGQVDSYKVVKSEKNADGWHIVILANIEKDVLQEETQKISIKKQTFEFDGTNNVAQKVTKEEKQKNAEDVISSIERLDFKDSIVYTAELREDKDKKIYYVRHYIGLDVKKVLNKLSNFSKILDKVSVTKKQSYFTTDVIKSNKIATNYEFMLQKLKLAKFEYHPNIINLHSGRFKFSPIPFGDLADKNLISESYASADGKCVTVIDSLAKLSLYCFDSNIKDTLKCIRPNNLNIVFKVEGDDETPLAVSEAKTFYFNSDDYYFNFRFGARMDDNVAFFPHFSDSSGNHTSNETYLFYFDQPFNLLDEEAMDTKRIKATYEITNEIPNKNCNLNI